MIHLKNQKRILLLVALISVAAFVFSASGGGWVPAWAEQLGITIDGAPAPTESFSEFSAEVNDPSKLEVFGLAGLKEGDEIVLKYAGNVGWKTKIGDEEIRPCLVRIGVPEGKSVTLVPDRTTLELKTSPPPYRGSLAKQPQN